MSTFESQDDDWLNNFNEPKARSFRFGSSFANMRRQLVHRKRVLQRKREQQQLMESREDDSNSSGEDGVHELGKPFLSSFTRHHLRNLRNKWKVEESETIVFGGDSSARINTYGSRSHLKDKRRTKSNNGEGQEVEEVCASVSKRSRKKRRKKRWMTRVTKKRILALRKASPRDCQKKTSFQKRKESNPKFGKQKTDQIAKPATAQKCGKATASSAPLSDSFQEQMAIRLGKRAQKEGSLSKILLEAGKGEDLEQRLQYLDGKENQQRVGEYDISSADRVAIGLEDERIGESPIDRIPPLVYSQGIHSEERNRERGKVMKTCTPYCYSSSDDDISRDRRDEIQMYQDPLRPSPNKAVVRVSGLATASFQGEYSEDSSLGSIPSVVIRFDEASNHSRESGFAGIGISADHENPLSTRNALRKKKELVSRAGRISERLSDPDARSQSSFESAMESMPSLLQGSIESPEHLKIVGTNGNRDVSSAVEPKSCPKNVIAIAMNRRVERVAQDEVDTHHLNISLDSIPSPMTSKQRRNSHHYQPQQYNDDSFSSTEAELDAQRLGERMEQAASPPSSPIQPTLLEVQANDDIPLKENGRQTTKKRRSIIKKLLSCGTGFKFVMPSTAKFDRSWRGNNYTKGWEKKKKNGIMKNIMGMRRGRSDLNSPKFYEHSGTSPTGSSFNTTSSPSGMTLSSSTTSASRLSPSLVRYNTPGSCSSRTKGDPNVCSTMLQTPTKERHISNIEGSPTKNSGGVRYQEKLSYTTPKSANTRKPFDYRRPTPSGAEMEDRLKRSNTKNSSVGLILYSFEKLTKKRTGSSKQQNSSRSGVRRVKTIMSKFQRRRLPMLMVLGLAALCQSMLNNLDGSNSIAMLCGGSSTSLMLLWDGLTADGDGMQRLAQSMLTQS